jgi:uncharacterized phiE125 gp8 family phage protein
MALNANALVTLAQAKSHLDIPTGNVNYDARVEQFINSVSDHIEYLTGRKLKQASYTHRFTGSGTPFLVLREYPVTAITTVHVDSAWVFGVGTLIAPNEYAILKKVGLIRQPPYLWDDSASYAIQIAYDAGFSIVPFDLQQAALAMLEVIFDMRDQRSTRIQSRSKLGDSVSWVEKVPEYITMMLMPHVREAYVKRQVEAF